MKHIKRLNENQLPFDFSKKEIDAEALAYAIDDLIGNYLEIEDVPYQIGDNMNSSAKQINSDSRMVASKAIVEYLKTQKLI